LPTFVIRASRYKKTKYSASNGSACSQTSSSYRNANSTLGCQASVGIHLEDTNGMGTVRQSVQGLAIVTECHIDRATACTDHARGGVEKGQGSILGNLIAGDRAATGIGRVRVLTVVGNSNPARCDLGIYHCRADYIEFAVINRI